MNALCVSCSVKRKVLWKDLVRQVQIFCHSFISVHQLFIVATFSPAVVITEIALRSELGWSSCLSKITTCCLQRADLGYLLVSVASTYQWRVPLFLQSQRKGESHDHDQFCLVRTINKIILSTLSIASFAVVVGCNGEWLQFPVSLFGHGIVLSSILVQQGHSIYDLLFCVWWCGSSLVYTGHLI